MAGGAQAALRHDPHARRFIAETAGGAGVLDYAEAGPRTLDYRHTFVPPALRGRGIATALVEYALDYALTEKLTVIPSCPFVAAVVRKHPEYTRLLAR